MILRSPEVGETRRELKNDGMQTTTACKNNMNLADESLMGDELINQVG